MGVVDSYRFTGPEDSVDYRVYLESTQHKKSRSRSVMGQISRLGSRRIPRLEEIRKLNYVLLGTFLNSNPSFQELENNIGVTKRYFY